VGTLISDPALGLRIFIFHGVKLVIYEFGCRISLFFLLNHSEMKEIKGLNLLWNMSSWVDPNIRSEDVDQTRGLKQQGLIFRESL
jgi:hypothetical protein